MGQGFISVITTTPTRRSAAKIARELVRARLAACAQVSGPIESVYRWKGAVETAREWVCAAKTRRGLYAKVEKAIREVHPYDTPEIVAVRIDRGSAKYLKWIEAETGAGRTRRG